MQAGQSPGQLFVVADQPAEAGGQGEAAFDHPALGQQREALPGGRPFDDAKHDAVIGGVLPALLAGVALIDVRGLHRFTRRVLYRHGQLTDRWAFLFIGGRDAGGRSKTPRVRGDVRLRAIRPLVRNPHAFAAIFSALAFASSSVPTYMNADSGRSSPSPLHKRSKLSIVSSSDV